MWAAVGVAGVPVESPSSSLVPSTINTDCAFRWSISKDIAPPDSSFWFMNPTVVLDRPSGQILGAARMTVSLGDARECMTQETLTDVQLCRMRTAANYRDLVVEFVLSGDDLCDATVIRTVGEAEDPRAFRWQDRTVVTIQQFNALKINERMPLFSYRSLMSYGWGEPLDGVSLSARPPLHMRTSTRLLFNGAHSMLNQTFNKMSLFQRAFLRNNDVGALTNILSSCKEFSRPERMACRPTRGLYDFSYSDWSRVIWGCNATMKEVPSAEANPIIESMTNSNPATWTDGDWAKWTLGNKNLLKDLTEIRKDPASYVEQFKQVSFQDKNWSPFSYSLGGGVERLFFAYSFDPLVVCQQDDELAADMKRSSRVNQEDLGHRRPDGIKHVYDTSADFDAGADPLFAGTGPFLINETHFPPNASVTNSWTPEDDEYPAKDLGCSVCNEVSSMGASSARELVEKAAAAYCFEHYQHRELRAPDEHKTALHLNGVPLLPFDNGYLGVVHTITDLTWYGNSRGKVTGLNRNYLHYFFTISKDPPFRVTRVSQVPLPLHSRLATTPWFLPCNILEEHVNANKEWPKVDAACAEHVSFISGMDWLPADTAGAIDTHDPTLLITYGVGDDSSRTLRLSAAKVRSFFEAERITAFP